MMKAIGTMMATNKVLKGNAEPLGVDGGVVVGGCVGLVVGDAVVVRLVIEVFSMKAKLEVADPVGGGIEAVMEEDWLGGGKF